MSANALVLPPLLQQPAAPDHHKQTNTRWVVILNPHRAVLQVELAQRRQAAHQRHQCPLVHRLAGLWEGVGGRWGQ